MGLGKEQGSQPLLLNPQLESGGGVRQGLRDQAPAPTTAQLPAWG